MRLDRDPSDLGGGRQEGVHVKVFAEEANGEGGTEERWSQSLELGVLAVLTVHGLHSLQQHWYRDRKIERVNIFRLGSYCRISGSSLSPEGSYE